MASNKELKATIVALAVELGEEVTTEGLNNEDLEKIVTILNEKKEAKALEEEKALAEAKALEKENKEVAGSITVLNKTYTVVKGKSITSKKGILGEGATVEASYLEGGEETLNNLFDRKLIVKG